jgi:hypothetical protein
VDAADKIGRRGDDAVFQVHQVQAHLEKLFLD